jgi:uncharacterized repeat protein (TIGR03803 family)
MTLLCFLGFPYAAATGARLCSQRRRPEISTSGRRGSLPAVLLAVALCLAASTPQSAGSEFEVLRSFTTTDGAHPFSDPVEGTDGMLYGTTVTGNNSAEHDAIFKINPDGSDFTVLMDFDEATTGGNCWGGLLLGSDGILYGTTFTGGTGNAGTVFKINQDGTGFAVLKNFDTSTTGGGSYARLLEVDEVLYGTTYLGGSGNAGTVFKLNLDGTGFAVLKHFANTTTGGHPTAGLTLGPDGSLYGTAHHGGSSLKGTIFKLETTGSSFVVLQHLDAAATGAFPQAGLLLGSDDALYGTATTGGDFEAGTIFKLNSDGTGFTVLKSLDTSVDGAMPVARLLESSSGKLYGTTVNGGSYGWGVVFELDPDGTDYRVVKRFNYTTHGGSLFAGLLQGSDGALYGAAAYGSDDDFGNVFRLVPTPNEAPTALAGSNQSVHAGTLTELNGTASLDDETSPAFLDYAWSFSSRPSGSTATLTDANTAFPSFTPDRLGTFVVQLIVTDEDGLSSTADTVEISSGNQAPTSVPAADFTVVVTGDLITFDASNSTDPDNDVLTYNWSFTSVPSRAGNVEFLDPQAEQPTFKPDVAGDYEVNLTVTDPWGGESSMPITITATAP